MKKVVLIENKDVRYVLGLMLCFFGISILNAQIKIGDNLKNVSPYSLLELESKERTLLLPRFSTLERDAAFDQDAPVGLVIFNTTTNQFEYFTQDKEDGIKKWVSSGGGSQIYNQENRPEIGQSGDLYIDEENNLFYAWNTITNQWELINKDSNVIIGDKNPNSIDNNLNSIDYNPELSNPKPGLLFVNFITGGVYVAADYESDGVTNHWRRLDRGGDDDLGNHIADRDLDLNNFSILDAKDSSGKKGQILKRASTGLEWSNFGISRGVGAPTVSNPVSPLSGDIYVDQSNGDLYTFDGSNWIRKPGVNITSGTGSPTTINPTNPIGGDIYIDNSTGYVYAYNSVSNTWVNQRKAVSDDFGNILIQGTDGLALLTSSTLSSALYTVSSTIADIVSTTLTSSTIQALETTTILNQDSSTGEITYTDEDGGTASATIVSGNGLNPDNILTVGLDGGSQLTSTTLNNALTNVSTVTITEIVSSTLISTTIQALETTTVLSQNDTTGIITYIDEDLNATDVDVISRQASNLILAGTDGGAFIDQSIINSVISGETITSISQSNLTGEIAYVDESGGTTSVTVVSGNGLDSSNFLTVGSDGGSQLTSTTLNNALTNVSTVTITEIVSSTLISTTIQALETTTTLTQSDTTGVITYVDEDLNATNVEVISGQASNLIRVGTDGGAFIDQSIISSAAASQTLTTLTQSDTTGVITYVDEDNNSNEVEVTSAQVSNLLRSGTDGGTLFTEADLSTAVRTISNTITQIVTSTLTSPTIQALETTTTLTQSDTTGVITYVDEDLNATNVEVISGQASNLIRVGTDGGAYISQSIINSAATSQTLTTLTQSDTTGVITYVDEELNVTTVEVTSAQVSNLLRSGTDGGTLFTEADLSTAVRTISNTITQIVTSTLTSPTIQALETTTTLSQNDTTGVITYVDEDNNSNEVEVTSAQVSNLLRSGTDGGTLFTEADLSTAVRTISNTITQIVTSTLTSETIQALETTTTLSQNDTTGVITYVDEDNNSNEVEVTSAQVSNLLRSGTDGGTLFTEADLSTAVRTISNTITQIVTSTLTSPTIQALETTTTLTQSDTTGVITYVDEDLNATAVEVTSADSDNFLLTGTDGGTKLTTNTLVAVIDSVSSTISSITGDDLGNHIAEQNIDLKNYQLVGDSTNTGTSGTSGLSVSASSTVGINITNPDNSAAFQVNSPAGTNAGVLIPKVILLTESDNVTIPSPAKGLMVYHTGNAQLREGFYWNKGTPTSPEWVTPEISTPEIGSTVRKIIYRANRPATVNLISHGDLEFTLRPHPTSTTSVEAFPHVRLKFGSSLVTQTLYYDREEVFANNNFRYTVASVVASNNNSWAPLTVNRILYGERNRMYISYNNDIYHVLFSVYDTGENDTSGNREYIYSILSERY
jgi:hypothetical protein